MLVKNIKGTEENVPYGYSDWHDFWEKKTGQKALRDLGGHVKKVNSDDNAWYIADISTAQSRLVDPYEYNGALAKLRD